MSTYLYESAIKVIADTLIKQEVSHYLELLCAETLGKLRKCKPRSAEYKTLENVAKIIGRMAKDIKPVNR